MSSVWTPNFDCNEEFNSRVETWNTNNPTVTVTLRCDMDNRYLIMADIVGNYRDYPFNTPVTLRASNAVIRLDRACKLPDGTGSRYETGYDSLIDVTYSFVKGQFYTQLTNNDWPESLFADEDMEPSMQFLTDDYSKYGWGITKVTDPLVMPMNDDLDDPGAMKAGEEPGKAFYQLAINRMVKGYPSLPTGYKPTYDTTTGDITAYEAVPFHKWPGTVHNEDYTSDVLSMDFPAGTLLFTQPKVVYGSGILKYLAGGIPLGPTWMVTAKLLYQEKGWNSFYRPKCNKQTKKAESDPYYAMVHKGCKDDQDVDGDYSRHLPYDYLDITEFLFMETEFPPDPWPPEPVTP